MAGELKQPFVVENRPGASNTIAADVTAKAPADGHTPLVATNTGQAIAPHLIKLGFDPNKDLTPVAPDRDRAERARDQSAGRCAGRQGAGGHDEVEADRVQLRLQWCRQHPASCRRGVQTGDRNANVARPHKGSAQAHLDLIAGSVQIMLDTTSSAMGHIKSGKLKALAVTSPRRSAELPDVPTLTELGFPAAEMTTWYGLYVTGGTPKEVVTRLVDEMQRVLKLPDVQARLRGLGGEPGGMTVEQFAALGRSEYERFGKADS